MLICSVSQVFVTRRKIPQSSLLLGYFLYAAFEQSFWSVQQTEVQPHCVFRPGNVADISAAIRTVRQTQCTFAVRSGGHAAFAGASNTPNGLTIDLRGLNKVKLSDDDTIAHIGTGNTWYEVYTALQPSNLMVIGGRVAAIGVGGLTTGGGISFFSGLHGWACDNVQNYEMVSVSGDILQVNISSYPDLYFALRGGGPNFGIVTRFDLFTYPLPQGLMWGGSLVYLMNYSSSILTAFIELGVNAPSDPNAALIIAYAYYEGQYLATADLEYAKPLADPAIFDDFKAVPSLQDTTGIKTQADITIEFNQLNPSGLRETYWTATYQLNYTMASYIVDIFVEETNVVANATGILPTYVLQVITTNQLSHMSKYGGNAFGLSTNEPLILLDLTYMWESAADDERILQACKNIVERTVTKSREWGLGEEYLYMNYASQFQDVVPSYGKENHERLFEVARKYDPERVFQKLQPGYFKLNGSPKRR